MPVVRPDRPAPRGVGMCSCGDERVKVAYEGRLWCGICALFCIGFGAAVDYFALIGEPLPKRGRALRRGLVSV